MGTIYYNKTKDIIKAMVTIYRPDGYDWMNYLITTRNILTFHHIIKECDGGLLTIENGALVTKKAHRILNMVEYRDIVLYQAWNDLFKEINKSREPIDEYFKNESRVLKLHTQNVLYK